MESSGDSQTVYQGFAGVRLTPTWSVIGSLRYATNDLGEISRFPSGILRWRRGRWVIGIGGGVFESELKKPEGSAVGFIRWEALPGLALQ